MNNQWKNKKFFFVGIKGTGMTALAEVISTLGAIVTGSDVEDIFYTDEVLERRGINWVIGFDAELLPEDTDIVVYSAAYSFDTTPQLKKAKELNMEMYSYPEMLGKLSEGYNSSGIAGTHGKTTTTAISGTLVKYLNIPSIVIAGSEVPTFGYSSSLIMGERFLVAETCEYRRHFLSFYPERIVLTTVEEDHLDYYRDLEDIYDAFVTYGRRLPFGGEVIYNSDDSGVETVVSVLKERRDDLSFVPVGTKANGFFRVTDIESLSGRTLFKIEGLKKYAKRPLELRVPGIHNVGNAAEAVALILSLLRESGMDFSSIDEGMRKEVVSSIREALVNFRGSRRRSEIIGEACGVLFMDDYGHHPTEIAKTLNGLSLFYPDRRIVVDFMSHTYSRTRALLKEFGRAFSDADMVILHKIYSSARETAGDISGKTLFEEVKRYHSNVKYFCEPMDAFDFLVRELKYGDLFVTMGAGDNWRLGKKLYEYFSEV